MINIIKKTYSKLDIHTAEVVRKSAISTIVKVIGMLVSLLVSVFLARKIGADGLGIINLSNRIVNVLIILGLLGMSQVIIKEVAIARNKKDISHIGNVMHTAYVLNGSVSAFISLIVIIFSPWVADTVFNKPELTYPLMIALIVMTPQVYSRIFSSGLVGYKKIWQSNLVDQTLSIIITGFIIFVLWILNIQISINLVAISFAIGRIFVTGCVGLYWNTLYKYNSKKNLIIKQLATTSIPLYIMSISTVLLANSDLIIIGIFASAKDIGLYAVASRLAMLTSFFLQVTNSSIAPKIAALFSLGKKPELEKMIQSVTKWLGIIGIISVMFFAIFGYKILAIWGEEFSQAFWVLIILSIGQFFNIASGAVGQILIMCGFEKLQSKISLFSMFIGIFFNILLVWRFGIIGAAISTSVMVLAINLTRIFYVSKKLGIKSISF